MRLAHPGKGVPDLEAVICAGITRISLQKSSLVDYTF